MGTSNDWRMFWLSRCWIKPVMLTVSRSADCVNSNPWQALSGRLALQLCS